jgi:large subunit ribosomal protein L11
MPPRKPLHRATMQLTAGAAAVAELGKTLGHTGVNLVELKRRYDELTAPQRGDVVPAAITVFDDRSFALVLRTPPTSFLLRRAARDGAISDEDLRAVARRKLPDLNTTDLDAAVRTVAGTARSMGLRVGKAALSSRG